jgi:hypothetical protein
MNSKLNNAMAVILIKEGIKWPAGFGKLILMTN